MRDPGLIPVRINLPLFTLLAQVLQVVGLKQWSLSSLTFPEVLQLTELMRSVAKSKRSAASMERDVFLFGHLATRFPSSF